MTEHKQDQCDTGPEPPRDGAAADSAGAEGTSSVPAVGPAPTPKASGGLGQELQFAIMSGLVTGLVLWFATPRFETPLILLFIPCYVVFIAWLKPRWVQTIAIIVALGVFTYADDISFQVESGDDPDKVGVAVAVQGVQYAGQGRKAQLSVNFLLTNNRTDPLEFDKVLVRTRSNGLVADDRDISMPSTRLDPDASVNIPVQFGGSWKHNRAWVKIIRTGQDQKPIASVRVVIPDR